jgi:conjugal transfer pilus assembly protein TraE
MILSKFLGRFEDANRTVRLLLIANLVMAFSLAAGYMLASSRHERIVLVPQHLTENASVEWEAASPEYYKGWAFYVANLIGNITPENLTFVVSRLGEIFSPKIFPVVKSHLLAMGRDPAFNSATSLSYFAPSRAIWEPGTKKVFVTGRYVNTTATQAGSYDRSQNVVLEFIFTMIDGRPLLIHFSSYEGTQPHTLAWRKTHDRAALEKELADNEKWKLQMNEAGIEDPDKFALDAAMMPPVLLTPTGEAIDDPGTMVKPAQSGDKP